MSKKASAIVRLGGWLSSLFLKGKDKKTAIVVADRVADTIDQ
jgi:hypothetical protein